ncbi:uncharacterized protein LOC113846085 isoform X2 [Abrus precatorius]|uniref:Uncharacterized protein LOC113846085 isoform X2 n=1 Tax=Abrus precatorius TaxID=3816 RepID=A0A8B8JE70_ABRPR|nr:uncharacterized protein LOC113846085 isoform X2 [Abrus precatorius]
MQRQGDTVFLEDWLKRRSGADPNKPPPPNARAIVQAWADLRASLQSSSFAQQHLYHLNTLVNSQASLHVAEPQARLLLAILQSPNLSLPRHSFPLFFRLLYVWARKAANPNPAVIDSAVEVLSRVIFSSQLDYCTPMFFSEAILLLGAFSFVHSLSERTKTLCLDMLCKVLIDRGEILGSFVPDVLAGIGYALSSSVDVHCVKLLGSMFGIWGKVNGPRGSVVDGLMVLYLIEWVVLNLIKFGYLDKIRVFVEEGFRDSEGRALFAVFMAAVGALRAADRSAMSGVKLDVLAGMRASAVAWIEGFVSGLVSRTLRFNNLASDPEDRLLLRCVSLGLARTGSFSGHSSLFVCLALALTSEILPLTRLYESENENSGSSSGLEVNEIKEHLDSISFKEAGAITGVFCNQYVLADEENKAMVENLIWEYCRGIYFRHRQVAMILKGKGDEMLEGLEKIAESAFLMVVVFALAVTKHKLNPKFSQEVQMEVSLKILVSFSCVEYFRHVRLPEYIETIRKVVAGVKNEHACSCFVNSMPSYVDLTNGPGMTYQKTKYLWSKDEVQTARILFYLRVIPTFIECLPRPVFRDMVVPTMFLYMEHPNGKVARASHSVFMAFMTMGKESEKNDKVSLKEQLVFHYIQRSLLRYPGITPFEGMASGVVGMVQHLPAGSPAIFYCIHSLVEKANQLCSEKRQGEPEPSKKLMDLLLRLVFLVDIQVLPDLMKLLAQLITKFPQDAQNIVLNELYSQVADSDDVVRKPTLVSWLQSLSYLCTKTTNQNAAYHKSESEDNLTLAGIAEPLNSGRATARL